MNMINVTNTVVVQSLSCVQLFVTPWTAACQASLFFTISRSLLKLMSIETMMHSTILSSVALFSFCPQSFPASGSFLMRLLLASGDQSIGASAPASVLPVNIQDWFSSGLTGLTSLESKGLSTVFSNTTVQKHQFFGAFYIVFEKPGNWVLYPRNIFKRWRRLCFSKGKFGANEVKYEGYNAVTWPFMTDLFWVVKKNERN